MNSVYFIGNVLTADQLLAFEAGTPNNELPHIFTNPFSNFFTNFGGGGSTLSLVICMLLFCKSERIKVLGRLSIVPGIFGINEPIIFGLPIVLNPIMIIPFIFVPLFNLVTSYLLNNSRNSAKDNRCQLTVDDSNRILRLVIDRKLDCRSMADYSAGYRMLYLFPIH